MKSINYISLMALAICLFTFGACSEIEKASIVTVSVPDFTVEIPAVIESPSTSNALMRADDGFRTFSGSAPIDISSANFADLEKYRDMITSIAIGTASVEITAATGTMAKDIVISATGVTPNFSISSYEFGTEYSTGLVTYATKIFNQFVKTGNITISISGKTDVDESTNKVDITIHFGDIDVKAQLITL